MSRGRTAQRGFTLIEVLIAVVILGTIGVALANSLVQGARRTVAAGEIGYRTAALNTEVSRIAALPSGSLADGTTTQTVTALPFPHTVTTVAATSGTRQTVTITVTPTGVRPIAPVTRIIQRVVGGGTPSPFGP